MIEIIPTNTCPPDRAELERRSLQFARFAPRVQLDIADGAFVNARSWPYSEDGEEAIGALPGAPQLSYEVHLMVEHPRALGEELARAGASRIIGHVEAFADAAAARSALNAWKSAGASEAGLAILFDTPFSSLQPLVAFCDVVQIMSIGKLGYQGAPFEQGSFERIRQLHAAYPDLIIEADGGVSEKNIEELVRAGATRFGIGSAITKAPDMKTAYEKLKSLAENAQDAVE